MGVVQVWSQGREEGAEQLEDKKLAPPTVCPPHPKNVY